MDENGFSARFSQIVDQLGGQNAAARHIGLSQGGVSRLISGGQPNLQTLRLITEKTGQSLLWLATGQEDNTGAIHIPLRDVFGSAGPGAEAIDEAPSRFLSFDPYFVRLWGIPAARVEALTARGDSMLPTIEDGAIVLIDTGDRKLREKPVFAFRTPDGVRFKRFQRTIDGGALLVSDNRDLYAPEKVGPADLEQFRIAGRAFWTPRMI